MTTNEGTLEQRAADLRAQLAAPSERERAAAELQRIEAKIVAGREAAGKAEAEARLAAIPTEYAAAVAALERAEQTLSAKGREYAADKARVNGCFRAVARLRAEDNAVRDHFGIAGPGLPAVAPPMTRARCREATAAVTAEGFMETGFTREHVEHDADGLRTRRTYREIAGTPGFVIIEAAGLKWPPLSARQQQVVAERAAAGEREEAAAEHLAATADREVARAAVRDFGGRTTKT